MSRLWSALLILISLLIITPAATTARVLLQDNPDATKIKLVELEFWHSIKDSPAPEEFELYLKKYPYGEFADLAKLRIKRLNAEKEERERKLKEEGERAAERNRPDPVSALDFSNQGDFYMGKNDYNNAITSYSRAISLNNKDYLTYYNRGLAYKNNHKEERALADFTEAIKLNPKHVESIRERASIYHSLNDYENALANYNEAIKLSARDPELYRNRALTNSKKADRVAAIADYSKALELEFSCTTLQDRATIYEIQNDYKNVITDYTLLIEKCNGDAIDKSLQYSSRGHAYRLLKNYDKAISDFNIMVSLEKEWYFSYYNRALCYRDMGQREQAIADLKMASKLIDSYSDLDDVSEIKKLLQEYGVK